LGHQRYVARPWLPLALLFLTACDIDDGLPVSDVSDLEYRVDLTQRPDMAGTRCSLNGPVIDLEHDPVNCGACGRRWCSDPCLGGMCWNCDDPGLTACPAPGCVGGICTDLRTDTRNCGACGSACAQGHPCSNGVCL